MNRLESDSSSWTKYSNVLKTIGRCSVGAVLLAGLAPFAAIAKDYSSINIFGDSLVDGGNFFNISSELIGIGLPPTPPYAQQFSNGDVWSEQLAQSLDLAPAQSSVVLPSILSGTAPVPSEGINFAIGGSLSDDTNGIPGFAGLRSQIATFSTLSTVAPPAPATLNVIQAGGNDYNNAIINPDQSPATLATLPEQVTNNLVEAIAGLIDAGAADILVANLPNLGNQPYAQALNSFNPLSSAGLSALSTQHNLLLANKLTALEATSGANIIQLDVGSLIDGAIGSPDEFGFTNVTDSCLSDFVSITEFGAPCSNPDEFLFWDDVHPTAQTHSLIAQLAVDTLGKGEPQSVPEPVSTAAILLVGNGLLLRQKQRIG
ncbi:MAG: SGNH/GDSL hydrolase family protein [Phormidesmis sp.]